MKRRDFITLVSGAGAGLPFAVRAQEAGRIYRLGFLIPGSRNMPVIVAFFDELRHNGFIEGQNLAVIPGGFDVPNDRLTEHAVALVKAAPDAIVAGPELPLRALQDVTRTIPLIGMTEDMVADGLAASLSRPKGNTTGISLLSRELDGKRQDILMEGVPGARRMAAFADSNVTPPAHLQSLQEAAHLRGVELVIFGVARREEIVPATDKAKAAGAAAFNFLATPMFGAPGSGNSRPIIEHVRELRLPSIHQWPETADDGGLAAYGARFDQVWRQRARIVLRVLRGDKPADIPIDQPTKFELVINLKAAKAIGYQVPAGLVLRADRVIE
jgi:putative tryptophan/tyrosine transport system substrate-binding protein